MKEENNKEGEYHEVIEFVIMNGVKNEFLL